MAETHDLTTWTETPASTRCSRYRYDFATQQLQVQWRNNKNRGYVYDCGYEGYRQFARAVSKGTQINRALNGFDYRLMTPEEADAPSNSRRQGVASRVR